MRRYKILLVFVLGLTIISCGSRKKVVTKKAETNIETVKEPVEVEKEVKTNSPKITAPVINSTTQYISVYKDIAMDEMRAYKIPASITLAQGILESGSGKGTLAVKANNHFGIKCHDWKGKKIYHDDDRKQECFRKYKSSETSFKDHSEFLAKRKRYASLFKLRKNDYKAWAKGLRQAGYATDKKYPQKLISLIERYELYQYDKEVLGKRYKEIKIENITHKVVKGDTLYSISKRYSITVATLQNINNLEGTTLHIGQILQLPKE
ncbi:MAG: glucosaminidase domain-containing protein [Bacteroidetes bacterium]|nr:glucosaminidase domain-containing protein [Bacteroidota bacterium]